MSRTDDLLTCIRYQLADEFKAGCAAGIADACRDLSRSHAWQAGWDAGYDLRKEQMQRFNEYLVSMDHNPLDVVPCEERS